MTEATKQPSRLVFHPRRWVLMNSVAAAGVIGAGSLVVPVSRLSAEEAGEAGEAGAVAEMEGAAKYLTELGLFEAAIRIVARLYADGDTALALEHLEASHHADYDDIATHLVEYGAESIEAAAKAFASAVEDGAAPEAVAAAAEAVFSGIAAAHRVPNVNAADEMAAIHALVGIAAMDFDAGVTGGKVVEGQEFRDAWGFVEVARVHGGILAVSGQQDEAEAGASVLEQLKTTDPLFPSLSATEVANDSGLLHAAAAWIEIARLRME